MFNTLSVSPYSPLPLESTPTSYKKERCLDITCTFGICSVHTVIVSKKWRGFKAKLLYRVVYRRSGQTKADITDITTQVHARFHLFLGDKCYHGNQCGYPGNGYYQSVNQTEKCLFGFRQTFTFKLWELVSAERVTLPCHLFSWMSMLAAAWKLSLCRVSRTGGGIFTVYRLKLSPSRASILARCPSQTAKCHFIQIQLKWQTSNRRWGNLPVLAICMSAVASEELWPETSQSSTIIIWSLCECAYVN